MSELITRLPLPVLILFFLFAYLSCTETDNKVPESTLELRDSLIYKKGSENPFTGRERALIENKIIEYDVVKGVKTGEFKLYYENGNLEIAGNLQNNLNVGRWQYFYETGQIESEGDFVDNFPDGVWKWYYRSGDLREEGRFIKGNRIGVWRQFSKQGDIIEENEFLLSDSLNTTPDRIENLKNNNFQK